MWVQILKFELNYRKRRPVTYIYFLVFFLMAFLAISLNADKFAGVVNQVKQNSPLVISNLMVKLSLIFTLITSAIMGVPVLRDFEHGTESLMFVNPIKKADYLFGRFLGSFVVLVLISTGVLFGFMLGDVMPWREADKLLPFSFANYLFPYLIFLLPNLFIMGVLFFVSGSLSRKILVVYIQGVLLIVLFIISKSLISQIGNRSLASLLDPFGTAAIKYHTAYWSIVEQNTKFIGLSTDIIINRLFWFGISFVGLVVVYKGFSFNVVRNSFIFKKVKEHNNKTTPIKLSIPTLKLQYNTKTTLKKKAHLSLFYAKNIVKEVTFIAIVLSGFILQIVKVAQSGDKIGIELIPTTYHMIGILEMFMLFIQT